MKEEVLLRLKSDVEKIRAEIGEVSQSTKETERKLATLTEAIQELRAGEQEIIDVIMVMDCLFQ